MSESSSGSIARNFSIWRTAWITVVWSRRLKAWAIAGRERSVCSRVRYMASCLARAIEAARLEERAELEDPGEHRGALLYAAVRWIDEFPRDLSAVEREGNFRKVFPFGGDVGEWAEAALATGGAGR